MDKYQLEMLKGLSFVLKSDKGDGTAIIEDDKLIITQNDNYNIVDYELKCNNSSVLEIEGYNNEWLTNNNKSINISFNNKISKLKIIFDLVDPIELSVRFIEADKKAFDEKRNILKIEEYKKNMNACIIHNLFGAPFVIFNPCCENYSYTEAEFIATNAQGTENNIFPNIRGSYRGEAVTQYSLNKGPVFEIVLERKRNKEGCNYIMFEPIGRCGLKVHIYQYDKNDNLLVDSIVS